MYQPMARQTDAFYNINHGPIPINTTHTIKDYGNMPKVFGGQTPVNINGYDPKSGFNNHRFINQNNILHNNLHQILQNEEIREYSVLIDSKDRNYQVYPDPFMYEVRFNPLPSSREVINGVVHKFEAPSPVINDNFINVRYIKLEDAILPFFTKIKKNNKPNNSMDLWNINVARPLTEYLYIVLSIGEYTDVNYRSTNDVLGDSFSTIYYDYRINDTHYKGYTRNGIKIFEQDQLGKIDKLKISFMDPYGRPLTVGHVNKKIKSNLECTCEDNPENEINCFEHNLFHPLNPLFQHHLHFKVGVLESRLNKITFD